SAACPESFEGRLVYPACPDLRGELRRAAAFTVHTPSPKRSMPILCVLTLSLVIPLALSEVEGTAAAPFSISSRPVLSCRPKQPHSVSQRPTLSFRPERPDFLFRADVWRVGPRSGGIVAHSCPH